MSVVYRLQELASADKIPLYMCSIELQKPCDSADRELLWTVLARYRVSPEMMSVFRQFQDGTRMCVRKDECKYSEWFEAGQGPRQGCVISPLLFSIFFTAAITVAVRRFGVDADIMADLLHLAEEVPQEGGWGAVRRKCQRR